MLVQSAPPQEQTISLGTGYLRAKRVLDVTITLLLLPLFCLVVPVIALLIRLDSPGPILYRQKRIGQNGKAFDFFKFRSMYVNTDDTLHRSAIQSFMNGERLSDERSTRNLYKLNDDRRITRVGKFIRKTSLDELPQFLNVLRGEMSLVGPRPPLDYEFERYDERARLRLLGKPGLTGVWQVYGRSRVSYNEMIEMDIAYLEAQSVLLDLKLIFLTIPVMLLGRGGG
ncbi:MAG TPA: sugar transferase [Ktedonobacteraceae bacterium]|jgi:lipopolysaccharide/colanic/teichoic acid biosynthesis glycosyltransferase|nr:sugar transferase [Ktedonobacteraceae bacterium]